MKIVNGILEAVGAVTEVIVVILGIMFVSGPIYLWYYFIACPAMGVPRQKFVLCREAVAATWDYFHEKEAS